MLRKVIAFPLTFKFKLEEKQPEVNNNTLDKLHGTSLVDFLAHSKSESTDGTWFAPIDATSKVKLTSTDTFSPTIRGLMKDHAGQSRTIIAGNAGGFHAIASLAANFAARGTAVKAHELIILDKNEANIQNGIYNILLAQIAATKEEFLADIFGIDASEVESLDMKKLKKYILDKNSEQGYNRAEHLENLLTKAAVYIKGKDEKLFLLFKNVAENITAHLATGDNYKEFVEDMFTNMNENKDHHFATNDAVYKGLRSMIDLDKKSYHIHFMTGVDLGSQKSIDTVTDTLKSYDINGSNNSVPIDIAYVPHVKRIDGIVHYLKHNTQYTVSADRDARDKRFWSYVPSHELSIGGQDAPGLEKYKTEAHSAVKMMDLSAMPDFKGIPNVMFLKPFIGYAYADEKHLNMMVDIAIADKVDTVFVQSGFYSNYFYVGNDKRKLSDPEFHSLDSRLEAFRNMVKKLNDNGIKVVYQMAQEEQNLANNLFQLYLDKQSLDSGAKRIRTQSAYSDREDKNSKYDWVKIIINEDLIPYLIRAGKDLTRFYNEEGEDSNIVNLINALKKAKDHIPLGDLEQYIDTRYLTDTDNFKVVFEAKEHFDNKDNRLGVQMGKRTLFSGATQPKDVSKGIESLIQKQLNGSLGEGHEEQIITDMQPAVLMFKVIDGKVAVMVPEMVDDRRYEDQGFLNANRKQVQGDPVHKRATQSNPNTPGSLQIEGDILTRMQVHPYFPKIWENMENAKINGDYKDTAVFILQDTQLGSLTERPDLMLSAMDHFIYDVPAEVKGIIGVGDFIQGWNYSHFPIENRHLGSASVGAQQEGFVRLLRPWLTAAQGTVAVNQFVHNRQHLTEDDSRIIREQLTQKGILSRVYVPTGQEVYRLNEQIDLLAQDLDLGLAKAANGRDYRKYAITILEDLKQIQTLSFFRAVVGNHEWNTDRSDQGHNFILPLVIELENIKRFSGSKMEIDTPEFLRTRDGDVVEAPFGYTNINDYGIVYSHQFQQRGGKGSTRNPTTQAAEWMRSLGNMTSEFDIALAGHYHILELLVRDNKFMGVLGSYATQSGFEQRRGYKSSPMGVVLHFAADGRFWLELLGEEFLLNRKIKNPEVKARSLAGHITDSFTQTISPFGSNINNLRPLNRRELVDAKKAG